MNVPMREKYVDERTGIWFIFGESRDKSRADVVDQDRDLFDNLPRDVAEQICAAQAEFRAKLYEILCYEVEEV